MVIAYRVDVGAPAGGGAPGHAAQWIVFQVFRDEDEAMRWLEEA